MYQLNTPAQYSTSIHQLNTPAQYTSSTYQINIPAQHTTSIYQLNLPAQYTSSIHQLNTPAQHTRSIYQLNISAQYTSSIHQLNILAQYTRCIYSHKFALGFGESRLTFPLGFTQFLCAGTRTPQHGALCRQVRVMQSKGAAVGVRALNTWRAVQPHLHSAVRSTPDRDNVVNAPFRLLYLRNRNRYPLYRTPGESRGLSGYFGNRTNVLPLSCFDCRSPCITMAS
jgi:hypothetical protein